MRPDESGTSCNQYFHIATGSKLGGKGEERKEEVCRPEIDERFRSRDFPASSLFGFYSFDIEQVWNGI